MKNKHSISKETILDTALVIAKKKSWESMKLFEVARTLDISLNTINVYFHQKDDIAEALFDRADNAMLALCEKEGFQSLSINNRLQNFILSWLSILEPHRNSVKDIIKYKLNFGHIHLQGSGVTRISRTVQWMREAAQCESDGILRELEETALTGIFVSTFLLWLQDPNKAISHLDISLTRAEKMAKWIL